MDSNQSSENNTSANEEVVVTKEPAEPPKENVEVEKEKDSSASADDTKEVEDGTETQPVATAVEDDAYKMDVDEIIVSNEAPSVTPQKNVQELKNKEDESIPEIVIETEKMLFVNSDNNSNDTANVVDVPIESDPIASESPKEIEGTEDSIEIITADAQANETVDFILPDIEKTNSDAKEDKHVIANYRGNETMICMMCLKQGTIIYSCTFKEATTYICSEACFNKFKDTHEGKYTKQSIRVKVFDTQERTAFSDDSCVNAEKCKYCERPAKENYFLWESYTFCGVDCLTNFQKSIGSHCLACGKLKTTDLLGKYCVRFGLILKVFCSIDCFSKHKKSTRSCGYCQADLLHDYQKKFCSEICASKHQNTPLEKSVKECSVCHNQKPVEVEFLNSERHSFYFCGEPCFVAYKFVNNVDPTQCEVCNKYVYRNLLEYSVRNNGFVHNLCSEKCKSIYIVASRKIVKCHMCNVKKYNYDSIEKDSLMFCSLGCYLRSSNKTAASKSCDYCQKTRSSRIHLKITDGGQRTFCSYNCLTNFQCDKSKKKKTTEPAMQMPIITSVQSLAGTTPNILNGTTEKQHIRQMVFIKPTEFVQQKNMATMVKPNQVTKGISCKPKESNKGTQTDEVKERNILIPIPVPIYVPCPMHMFCSPVPIPVPFPLPIPVPIFIPTNRNTTKGIFKEINKIKNKVPADPLEAELLMMAEMVAEDKKHDSDSGSEDDENENETEPPVTENFTEPESTNFGEDMLQMALKMASDLEEPVDLEGEVSASMIVPPGGQVEVNYEQTKKRGRPPKANKRPRPDVPPVVTQTTPTQKPDANLCLKYTFGVNAWKQWVTTKNAELEKSSRRAKLFKTEILQLTADELNYSLCLFVKEVRKPNGSEYAPDTIYYLCLGIQQYLYENGRIDNMFCDAFYEKFTDCLNDVCRKFSVLYNESQYIVTRVEEEHLWESKQLGAHSPLVLLNTLMFFNTKHFSLTSVEEHLQLSFSHIMKHWKRNPSQPGARNVLLRFYPPQNAQIENRKKKMYEQQENEDNPLRCPVKLYEFYLSKCPESVKTRNDVFYLLPERSCVPDSPLWYSTMPLDKASLEKMLNRVKMVKEINVALLTS